jgi:short-subunit dehydrogenase
MPLVVIITGASSGIGAAVAVQLARQRQARIGLFARRLEKLEEVAEQVRQAGGEALPVVCDVVDPAMVQAAVEQVRTAWGPIDIAIANAGIGEPLPVKRFTAERVARTMRINVEGAANLFAAVLPEMLERHQGQLVGVSSIARWRGLPRSGSYSASKAALTTLMESMRLELRAEGIAVTAVHPGFVVTPMTEKNAFRMPFLMDVDKAARVTTRGILERRRDVNYPRAMVLAVQLSRLMPNWLYDRLMGGKAGWTLKPEGKRPR